MQQILYAALALIAGVFIPVMASLSGALGRAIGNPVSAAILTTAVAFCGVLIFALISGAPFSVLKAVPAAPPQQILAGLGMAFYVVSITFLAPRFGLGNSIMLVVAAQIGTSAAIDHWGLLGAVKTPISGMRALGLGVMIAGVVIAQLAASQQHMQAARASH
jgi:transporter family-2 protein